MTDEGKAFIAERFDNGKKDEKELEEYKSFSDDFRKVYREECKRHPEWSHAMVLASTNIHAHIKEQQLRNDSMRGGDLILPILID